MKKITKIISVIAGSVVLLFYACEKDIMKQGNTATFDSFNYEGIKKANGMLEFKDRETLVRVVKELAEARKSLKQKETKHSENDELDMSVWLDPVLDAFENRFQHSSLRKVIINEQIRLMKDGTWGPDNDPDDHFIPDPQLRTIFNANGEFKVGDSIVRYLPDNYIAVIPGKNTATLEKLRAITKYNPAASDLPTGYIIVSSDKPLYQKTCSNFCPKASFIFTSNGLELSFTDQSTSGFPITHWSWDFGDGTTSTVQNPVHQYSGTGSYTVRLTVYDAAGRNDAYSNTIYLYTTGTSGACNADAAFSYDNTDNDLTVTFFNESTSFDLVGTQYFWRFGDGNTSTMENPTHTYSAPGCYKVTLEMTDGAGCQSSETKNVPANDCTGFEDDASEKISWKDYADKRRMKVKLWSFNFVVHAFGSDTKNYKKFAGIWWPNKADQIGTSIYGGIYFSNQCIVDGNNDNTQKVKCSLWYDVELYDWQYNKNQAEITYYPQDKFWTSQGSLRSRHALVEDGKTYIFPFDLSIH